MKRGALLSVILISICLLFPNLIEAKEGKASLDLKGENRLPRSFAVKSGDTYYLNKWVLENEDFGVYKLSKDLKQSQLIKKGHYNNINIYGDTFILFNEDEGLLEQLSLEGKVIKQYPEVDSNRFLIDGNFIYYNTENQLYQISINGKGNTLLFKPKNKNTVQEFTVNNGWLYFTYTTPVNDDPYDLTSTSSLAKIKINSPKKETLLIENMANIDSIIVRDGYIYSVIHKNPGEIGLGLGRYLYRMDYSGKNLKRVSNVNVSSSFIGTKYIYFLNSTFDAKQTLFRMTVDGKNVEKVGTIPGRKFSFEYYDDVFYFEYTTPKQYKMSLHRISI